jgi:hypothetical protein
VIATDNLKGQRIATVVEAGSYGRGLNKAFEAALPKSAQVVFTTEVGAKDNVTPEMATKIKAANADVVVLFAREPQLVSLFAALKQVGHTEVFVLGTNVVRNKNVAALPIPVKAFYATATAIDAAEFAHGKQFLSRVRHQVRQLARVGCPLCLRRGLRTRRCRAPQRLAEERCPARNPEAHRPRDARSPEHAVHRERRTALPEHRAVPGRTRRVGAAAGVGELVVAPLLLSLPRRRAAGRQCAVPW